MSDYDLGALWFWAKTTEDAQPGIDVFHHTVHVGLVAHGIATARIGQLARFGLRVEVVAAIAALHDIGKISPGFQVKCPAWLTRFQLTDAAAYQSWSGLEDSSRGETHDQVSQFTAQNLLSASGLQPRDAATWAVPVGAHHSTVRTRPQSVAARCGMSTASNVTRDDEWEALRQQTAQRIVAAVGALPCADDLPALASGLDSPALWWLAGLVSIADWIGSDERYFASDRNPPRDESEALASAAVATIGFDPPTVRSDLEFTDYFGFEPNNLQRQAMQLIAEPGLYVIEAPMGMGKTEAALACAYRLLAQGKASGIYFALPTQVTSNRIHFRVQAFLDAVLAQADQGERARLIHAHSWLLDSLDLPRPAQTQPRTSFDSDARAGVDWFASRKRALLANFGVGTVDQALLGIVATRHFFVRQFGLAGKVVIVDEVHSYDFYTGTLIRRLCQTLLDLGCTVIVLSATLDGPRRAALLDEGLVNESAPYPLISGRLPNGEPLMPCAPTPPDDRRVSIQFVDADEAIRRVHELASAGVCILWICDTVASAQSTFARFQALASSSQEEASELGLLHSRFPQFMRENREAHWMAALGKPNADSPSARPNGCILVSTQVVEQSVDLDADLLVTELAPTDMLLQRIGRLWRHDRGARPIENAQCWIIEEACELDQFDAMNKQKIRQMLGSKGWVYAPYVLLRALEVWQAKVQTGVAIPSEIRDLIRNTYAPRDEPSDGRAEWLSEVEGGKIALAQRALMASNFSQPLLDDLEGTQTRVSTITTVQLVLVRQLDGQRLTLLNGQEVDLSGDRFDLPIAKALHRNICKIDEKVFSAFKSNELSKRYVKGKQALAVIEGDGAIVVPGCTLRKSLLWSKHLGLVSERIVKEAPDDEPCD